MGFSLKKIATGAGIGAILPSVGLGFAQTGLDMISSKYQTDQQGHLLNEMFDKQAGENAMAFARNKAWEQQKWDMQNKRADEVWEREKAYNLDLWNKTNEYNSPAAQMQRLKDAGLNPNLMYGQGTTGNAAVIHSSEINQPGMGDAEYEAARAGSPDYKAPSFGSNVVDGIKAYMGIRSVGIQQQNMMATTSLIAANADRVREDTRRMKMINDEYDKTGYVPGDSFWNNPIFRGIGRAGSKFGQMMKEWANSDSAVRRLNVSPDFGAVGDAGNPPMFQPW